MKAVLTGGLGKELPDLNLRENPHLKSLGNKVLPSRLGKPCSSSANIACALWGNLELQTFCAIGCVPLQYTHF